MGLFKRKIFAFILTVIVGMPIIGFCFMLVERSSISEVPGLIVFASIYVTPVTLLYGVPVSILSDKMNHKFFEKKRVFVALALHLFFGIVFTFFFILIADSRSFITNYNGFDTYFLVASTGTSFVFWGMDEMLRVLNRRTKFSWNIKA